MLDHIVLDQIACFWSKRGPETLYDKGAPSLNSVTTSESNGVDSQRFRASECVYIARDVDTAWRDSHVSCVLCVETCW